MSSINDWLEAIAPQLINDPKLDKHIQIAKNLTSSACFGDNYNYAVALRASHTLTVANRLDGNLAGNYTAVREGDIAINLGGNSGKQGNYLSSTSYGQELQGLINSCIAGASVASCNNLSC